jgi:hypothetical protein
MLAAIKSRDHSKQPVSQTINTFRRSVACEMLVFVFCFVEWYSFLGRWRKKLTFQRVCGMTSKRLIVLGVSKVMLPIENSFLSRYVSMCLQLDRHLLGHHKYLHSYCDDIGRRWKPEKVKKVIDP